MPLRPRSHHLEDESINEFIRVLPTQWVVRRKDHDYGVDLEVEIFDENGRATGLTFNVQLKATDDPDKSTLVSIGTDKLEYYGALPAPTLVVRYCSDGKSFFSQWNANILAAQTLSDGQQSITYRFCEQERWTADRPASIERTLRVLRRLEEARPSTPIYLSLHFEQLTDQQRWVVEGAVHDVQTSAPDILKGADKDVAIEINVAVDPMKIRVAIDCLSSISMEIESLDRKQLSPLIRYAVVALLAHHRITHQAERVARALVARQETTRSSFVAFEACRALANDLEKSVELAILNGLHSQSNKYYGPFTLLLLTHPQDEMRRAAAIEFFFKNARTAAREHGSDSEAAVCYSLGNHYRSRFEYAKAIRQYNLARKIRPAYCQTPYFVGELGACLFGAAHF